LCKTNQIDDRQMETDANDKSKWHRVFLSGSLPQERSRRREDAKTNTVRKDSKLDRVPNSVNIHTESLKHGCWNSRAQWMLNSIGGRRPVLVRTSRYAAADVLVRHKYAMESRPDRVTVLCRVFVSVAVTTFPKKRQYGLY
jgi:hypothetical protein